MNNSGMEKPERESNPQPYCYRSTVFATAALCLPVSYMLIINLLLQKVNRTGFTDDQITFGIVPAVNVNSVDDFLTAALNSEENTAYYYHVHPYPQSVADQVFCWMFHRVTHSSWQRRSFFFFQHCNSAHNYSHAWLQMPAYLCQFGPVRICTSTPHRCLSLHRFPGSHTWAFLSMPAPERNHSCTIGLHVLWLWQPSGILLILFYFIYTDSYLVVGWGYCWGWGLWDRGQGCFPGIKDFLAAY